MPDEIQNQIPDEAVVNNGQEGEAGILPMIDSESTGMPSTAPDGPKTEGDAILVNNPTDTIVQEITPETQAKSAPLEPVVSTTESDPNMKSETETTAEEPSTGQTAQLPVNEPLEPETEPLGSVSSRDPQSSPAPVSVEPQNKTSVTKELLLKARNTIQFRKRKRIDKIMTMFSKKQKITNDEVEKLLHVSDATATRYLSQLEKEGKIVQDGKTGKSVSYRKV